MLVNGTLNVTVDIPTKEALKVVLAALGYRENTHDSGFCVLQKDDGNNTTGETGLFQWEDISYHGSPCITYHLVSHDPDVIQKFLLGEQLSSLQKAGKLK